MKTLLRSLSFVCAGLFAASPLVAQTFTLAQTNLSVPTASGYRPAPIDVAVQGSGDLVAANLRATSDSAWLTPTIVTDASTPLVRLSFVASALPTTASTATVTVTDRITSRTLFVRATPVSGGVTKLLDDPFRSRTYGLIPGTEGGAVVVFDPVAAQPVASIGVGRRPTDLVVSRDGRELLVLNHGDVTISVVNLETLKVTETLGRLVGPSPQPDSAPSELALGPGNIIYFSDASWAPVLRVYDRATRTVLQAIDVEGQAVSTTTTYNGSNGFGSFVVSPDGKALYAWAQYGYSAGWAGSYISRFTIGNGGRLTFAEKTDSNYPTALDRDPFDTPALMPVTGGTVFIKEFAVAADNVRAVRRTFPTPVYAITPGGEAAATASAIFHATSGEKLRDLPANTTVQVITSDYARLVYFDRPAGSLKTIDLAALAPALGVGVTPADGSVVFSPASLGWSPLPGVDLFDVYLGTSLAEVQAASGPSSPQYLGTVAGNSLALLKTLPPGTTYYWRVDAVRPEGTSTGAVRSFTVSRVAATPSAISLATVAGDGSREVVVDVSAPAPISFTVTSGAAWMEVSSATFTTPTKVSVRFAAETLEPGTYQSNLTLGNGQGTVVTIPVTFTVEPLALTILKSDPGSRFVYGISEDNTPSARAYLLEIDTQSERITRSLDVGTGVTDLALHKPDGRAYVPNWNEGTLRAINLNGFTLARTYAFTPAGSSGYRNGDAYRVSAGALGRIIVEEQDQWIDVSLIDTTTGTTVAKTSQREGGGSFDPTGRYYYHGDSNISNASLHRFDTAGDTFTELGSIRIEGISYYGSRTVVVSGDGATIFWNGAAFDATLKEKWRIGDEIFSSSADGRLAAGKFQIHDTVLQQAVLALPRETRVTAINSSANKLVLQNGTRLAFFNLLDPLLPPTEVQATSSVGNTADVSWLDRSLETGFTLQYRLAGTTPWTDAPALVAANRTTLRVEGLQGGSTYEFRVKADGAVASSDWSAIATTTVAGSLPVMTAPDLKSPTLAGDVVVLTWGASELATSYLVERSADFGAWTVLANLGHGQTSYLDGDITPGAGYRYRVSAVSGSVSVPSAVRSITIPTPGFGPLLATLNDGIVTLTWESELDATGYRVERAPISLQSIPPNWTFVADLPPTSRRYLDALPLWAQQFSYRVTALGTSAPALTAFVEADPTPTPTPTPKPPTADRIKPRLAVLGSRPRVTNAARMLLAGTASDNRALARVEYRVGSRRGFQRANGLEAWFANVTLEPGFNVITLRAVDTAGNASVETRVVILRTGARSRR